eukprot:8317840-Pyramimonas_sp.AAC.2
MPRTDLPPPLSHALRAILDRVRPSALGPDSPPCEAWKRALMGIEVLADRMRWALEGHSFGSDFHCSI